MKWGTQSFFKYYYLYLYVLKLRVTDSTNWINHHSFSVVAIGHSSNNRMLSLHDGPTNLNNNKWVYGVSWSDEMRCYAVVKGLARRGLTSSKDHDTTGLRKYLTLCVSWSIAGLWSWLFPSRCKPSVYSGFDFRGRSPRFPLPTVAARVLLWPYRFTVILRLDYQLWKWKEEKYFKKRKHR